MEVANRMAEGERVRIRAKGNSMLPFIRDGKDMIVLEKPNEQSFRKGCLLLALLKDGRYVLHRVKKVDAIVNQSMDVAVNETCLLLHGDGNLATFETCTRQEVIAEATIVIRGKRKIRKGSWRWKMYRYLWPRNLLARRILLGLYRRIQLITN